MRSLRILCLSAGLIAALSSSAFGQLILAPIPTFGTNGDGSIRPGERTYLTSDGSRFQRGMAYNPTTDHLIIVNRTPLGSETLNIIDASTGNDVGTLNTCCLSVGGSASFVYNMVAVADDGAIYVGNLVTTTANLPFNLYRWENESANQTLVYYGDPRNGLTNAPGTRWGDTMAVRGTGVNTEIVIGSQNGTTFVIFRPTDAYMTNFTATTITTPLPAGALGHGIAFGAGDTIWGKGASAEGSPLFRLSYDLVTSNATPAQTYPLTSFPGRVGPIGINLASNMLVGLEMVAAPDPVRLYQMPNGTNLVFQDRRDFPTNAANNIYAGSITFGPSNRVYALNADNGILGLQFETGISTNAPHIFYNSGSLISPISSNVVLTVGADGALPLSYQWLRSGTNLLGETNVTFTITNGQTANSGSYSVIVTNSYGSVTSAVAVVTILGSIGNSLVYDPFAYTVGSDVVGQGGWLLNGSGASATVEEGNLGTLGLAASAGNRAVMPTSSTSSTRLPIGQYTNGAIYFSFNFRLKNIIGTASETVAGFAQGTSTAFANKLNVVGDGVGNTYQLGCYKGGGTTVGALAPNLFTTNDTVFVVLRYTINPGSANDVCDMWLNPHPSTFGSASAPPATVGPIGTSSGTDLAPLDRIFMRVGQTAVYPGRTFDEIRVGFDWASVTPEGSPPLEIGQSGDNAVIFWPSYVGTNFIVQRIRQLDDPDGWETLTASPVVQGTNNTVTLPISDRRLFRLRGQPH